jgi:uncharacterized membrane protein YwzB
MSLLTFNLSLCLDAAKVWAVTLYLVLAAWHLQAQTYDLLIKNGQVIDAASNTSGMLDIAILGDEIVAIRANISPTDARRVIDVYWIAFECTHGQPKAAVLVHALF